MADNHSRSGDSGLSDEDGSSVILRERTDKETRGTTDREQRRSPAVNPDSSVKHSSDLRESAGRVQGVIPMKEKLKSRKLFVAIALIAVSLTSAVSGLVPWVEGIESAVQIGMCYLGAQGLPDAAQSLMPLMKTLTSESKK